MTPNPAGVALIGTCPYCHEAVEMVITKKQAKLLYKSFKMNIHEAQRLTDKELETELLKSKRRV
jgi:predicted DCC family thiol-disulfide oxidoreductase YuxK